VLQNRTIRAVIGFLVLGLASEYLLWQTRENTVFFALMAPVLALSQLVESHLPFTVGLTPLQSELFFVFPFTLLYYGLVGYWLRQIDREEGILKYFILLSFIAFLVVVHWQAYAHLDALVYAKA